MTRKRQLALPGLRRSMGAPPTVRDFTASQFALALKRNGFAPTAGKFRLIDETGETDRLFEAVVRRDPIRIDRRATLAKIIRERQERAR